MAEQEGNHDTARLVKGTEDPLAWNGGPFLDDSLTMEKLTVSPPLKGAIPWTLTMQCVYGCRISSEERSMQFLNRSLICFVFS